MINHNNGVNAGQTYAENLDYDASLLCLATQSREDLSFNYLPNEISGFQLLTEAPEEIDWLIEGLVPRTGMGAVAGGSDLGKSAFLRQLGIETAAGSRSFLDFGLNQIHKSAIIVCTEDDQSAVSFLLRKQGTGHEPETLSNLRFVFQYENLLNELDEMLSNRPADLVIFDCFADCFGGDLKDTQKIRLFLSDFQHLSAKHSCFLMFLHHTAKRTENNEPSKNNLLSGQGFEAKMRLVIELRGDHNDDASRHLCIVKGNYLPSSMKRESFVLRFTGESLTFSNTGERTPFELLMKAGDDGGRAKYKEAVELRRHGLTMDQVAVKMGYANKGGVSKLLQRGESNNW